MGSAASANEAKTRIAKIISKLQQAKTEVCGSCVGDNGPGARKPPARSLTSTTEEVVSSLEKRLAQLKSEAEAVGELLHGGRNALTTHCVPRGDPRTAGGSEHAANNRELDSHPGGEDHANKHADHRDGPGEDLANKHDGLVVSENVSEKTGAVGGRVAEAIVNGAEHVGERGSATAAATSRLLSDYLAHEGLLVSAKCLAEGEGMQGLCDVEIYERRAKIVADLQRGQLDGAIAWCQEHRGTIKFFLGRKVVAGFFGGTKNDSGPAFWFFCGCSSGWGSACCRGVAAAVWLDIAAGTSLCCGSVDLLQVLILVGLPRTSSDSRSLSCGRLGATPKKSVFSFWRER